MRLPSWIGLGSHLLNVNIIVWILLLNTFIDMDLDEFLIEEVRNYPLLYDLGNADYKNMRKKEYAWRNVAANVKLSESECKKRWKNLRDSFQRCRRANEVASGSGAPIVKRKWRYYDAMSFLKGVTNCRRTINNMNNAESTNNAESSIEEVDESMGYESIIEEVSEEVEIIEVPVDIDETSVSVDASEPRSARSSLREQKKKDSEKFQKFLDLAASSINQTCAAFVGQNQPQSSTALHFASLAAKLTEAGLPPSAINEIEAQVSEIVLSGIRKYL